ncbi:MAG: hypothetical protein ISN29_02070 [Gammaproteobacteria bacterium AqS3]|nr:hypothetical protein [Gammaproteobacteria bacterium AqS3]
MSAISSNSSIVCIFNQGIELNTWAPDDPPYMIETDDFTETMKGQDGKYNIHNRFDEGGILTMHFMPYSPAVKWLIEQAMDRNAKLRGRERGNIYTCSLTDPDRGGQWYMTGGTLKHAPIMMNPTQTYTARFEFEVIAANVDSADFAPRFDDQGR